MKVELTIDRTKKLPDGAMPALEKELLKRLRNQFEDCVWLFVVLVRMG